MEALEQAILAAGGLTALANRMETSPQTIVNWRRRGVPAERVLDVEKATEGKVSRHKLRPDLYPEDAEQGRRSTDPHPEDA